MIFSNAFPVSYADLRIDLANAIVGYARLFRPTYAPRHAGAGGANVGHPSSPFGSCYDTDSAGTAENLSGAYLTTESIGLKARLAG